MKIIINNKIKLEKPNDSLKAILTDVLRHTNPAYTDAQKLGKSTRGINQFIYLFEFDDAQNMYIPRGFRMQLLDIVSQLNISYVLEDQRSVKLDTPYIDGSAIDYRPYQLPAVNSLVGAGPEGILVAPPGSGKTVMGLSLLPIVQQSGIWLTHTDNLFKQCYERCLQFLPNIEDGIGTIGAGKWSVGSVLTIAMIPTLVRNLDRLYEIKDEFGIVIVDECHHVPASTFTKVLSCLNPYFLYGLTATPYRRDGLESILFQSIGTITASISKDTVSKYKGIIAPTILYCGINYGPVVDRGLPAQIFKEHIIFNKKRNLRITDDVVREAAAGNYCIVASGRKAHCDILFELIKARWPQVGIATGAYSKKLIDEQIKAFNDKKITVLITTPELLGEGFDVDFLNRLFVTTSFRTESRAEQLIGRVQRFHPDKKDALVYEYVDENIGLFANQYYSPRGKCRSNVYNKLGLVTIDYKEYFK